MGTGSRREPAWAQPRSAQLRAVPRRISLSEGRAAELRLGGKRCPRQNGEEGGVPAEEEEEEPELVGVADVLAIFNNTSAF